MKNLKQILNKVEEEWVAGTKSTTRNEYREIFKNPSKSEINDILEFEGNKSNNIRFIAVKRTEDIYVTSIDVFHITIVYEIDEFENSWDIVNNFSGIGEVFGGRKIEVSEKFSDYLYEYPNKLYNRCAEIVDGDYDWMERYNFDLSGVKEFMKSKIDVINFLVEDDGLEFDEAVLQAFDLK